jgi:peroxiredoxin
VQVHRERERIRKAGAELAFVGNGTPAMARAFAEDYRLEVPLYVDPSRQTYRALGMGRPSVLSFLSPRLAAAAARALGGGHMQGAIRGDARQLGGALVVGTDGRVAFRHLSRDAGDHPPVTELVAAAERVAAAA